MIFECTPMTTLPNLVLMGDKYLNYFAVGLGAVRRQGKDADWRNIYATVQQERQAQDWHSSSLAVAK